MKRVDYIGKKYNRLTVLERDKKQFICKCDCGKMLYIQQSNLISGSTKSCGCLKKEVLSKRKISNLSVEMNAKLRYYKRNALTRKINFELDRTMFFNLILQNCKFCGTKPKSTNGIDRYDNNKGYTFSNSVPCCTICNRAKNDMSAKDFNSWIWLSYHYNFPKES